MTSPDSITVSGPEDILGYIPHSLGYWPADSLVAITLQGKRISATLRVDLPRSAGAAGAAQFALAVGQYLEADGKADGVVLAVFSSSTWENLPKEYAPLLEALDGRLAGQNLVIRDAWFVGDRYWRDALCLDSACCPWPGRPVEEIRDSRLNAELVYRGSSVGTAPAPAGSAASVRPVSPAEEQWLGRLSGYAGNRAMFLSVLEAWQHVLLRETPDSLNLDQVAYLRAGLRIPAWRDAVLVMGAAGPAVAVDGADRFGIFDGAVDVPNFPGPFPGAAAAAGDAGCGAGEVLAAAPAGVTDAPAPKPAVAEVPVMPGYGEVLLGLAPERPDWKRMEALDRVLQRLGTEGGGAAGAAALTGRGWIAWCRGRGSYAGAFLQEALECFPEYRLAQLLLELVGRGTLCGWAANPQSAWQKFDVDAA